MGSTAESVRAAVKRLAYQTSVEQLKRRGVDKVKVLGLDRITMLIQEAVSRSLSHKMASFDRRQLAAATRDEFLKLLESNQNLVRSHDKLNELKQQAEAQVDELRRELAEKSAQLQSKLMLARRQIRARFDGEDAVIAEKIQALFDNARSGPGEMKLDNLRGGVMELVLQVVNYERDQAIAAREAVRDRDVELLQRRINKLQTSLQETEHELRHVARVKNIDGGISSMYRDVQGLDENDAQFERKLELMTELFKANVMLQEGAQA